MRFQSIQRIYDWLKEGVDEIERRRALSSGVSSDRIGYYESKFKEAIEFAILRDDLPKKDACSMYASTINDARRNIGYVEAVIAESRAAKDCGFFDDQEEDGITLWDAVLRARVKREEKEIFKATRPAVCSKQKSL